jgi:hypothetical protein
VAAGSQAGGRIDARRRGRSEQTSLQVQTVERPTAVETVGGVPLCWCGPRGASRKTGTGDPPNRPRRAPTRHRTDLGPPTRPPTPPRNRPGPEGPARRPCRRGTREYDRAGRRRRGWARDFGWRSWREWPRRAECAGVSVPAAHAGAPRNRHDRASCFSATFRRTPARSTPHRPPSSRGCTRRRPGPSGGTPAGAAHRT